MGTPHSGADDPHQLLLFGDFVRLNGKRKCPVDYLATGWDFRSPGSLARSGALSFWVGGLLA